MKSARRTKQVDGELRVLKARGEIMKEYKMTVEAEKRLKEKYVRCTGGYPLYMAIRRIAEGTPCAL